MLEGNAVERKRKENGVLLLKRASCIALAMPEKLERDAHGGEG
jgi:hypothetical protein